MAIAGSAWHMHRGSHPAYVSTTLVLLKNHSCWLLYTGPQSGFTRLDSARANKLFENLSRVLGRSEAERRRKENEILNMARASIETKEVFRVQRVLVEDLGPKGYRSTLEGEANSTSICLAENGHIAIGFSDGRILVTSVPRLGADDEIQLPWTFCESYECAAPVHSCLLSNDGQRLYSLNGDGILQIVGRRQQSPRATETEMEVAFSPDGHWAAFKGVGHLTFLKDRRRNKGLRLEGVKKDVGSVFDSPRQIAVFTPDSTRLLAVGDEQTPFLYDLVNGSLTHLPEFG